MAVETPVGWKRPATPLSPARPAAQGTSLAWRLWLARLSVGMSRAGQWLWGAWSKSATLWAGAPLLGCYPDQAPALEGGSLDAPLVPPVSRCSSLVPWTYSESARTSVKYRNYKSYFRKEFSTVINKFFLAVLACSPRATDVLNPTHTCLMFSQSIFSSSTNDGFLQLSSYSKTDPRKRICLMCFKSCNLEIWGIKSNHTYRYI